VEVGKHNNVTAVDRSKIDKSNNNGKEVGSNGCDQGNSNCSKPNDHQNEPLPT